MSRSTSPAAGAFGSSVFSGLGHFATGSYGAAFLFIFLEAAGWAGLIAWAVLPEAMVPWVGLVLATVTGLRFLAIVSAVRTARRKAKRGGGVGAAFLIGSLVPGIVLVQAFLFIRFVMSTVVPLYGVPTSGMEPTLMGPVREHHRAPDCPFSESHHPPTGDHIVASRLAYWAGPVQRFDVVVFRFPLDPSKEFVQRVVGLPGEKVMLKGDALHVRGPGEEEFRVVPGPEGLAFRPARGYRPESLGEGQVLAIPTDSFFILGDNSGNSHDGRTWIRHVFEMKDGSRIECESQALETSLLRIKEITEREGLERPPEVVISGDREGRSRRLYREDIREERREPFRFVERKYLVGRAVKVWWPPARAGAIR